MAGCSRCQFHGCAIGTSSLGCQYCQFGLELLSIVFECWILMEDVVRTSIIISQAQHIPVQHWRHHSIHGWSYTGRILLWHIQHHRTKHWMAGVKFQHIQLFHGSKADVKRSCCVPTDQQHDTWPAQWDQQLIIISCCFQSFNQAESSPWMSLVSEIGSAVQ